MMFLLLTTLSIIVAAGYGYVQNFKYVLQHINDPSVTAAFVMHAIGIVVVPLGIIMGWFF